MVVDLADDLAGVIVGDIANLALAECCLELRNVDGSRVVGVDVLKLFFQTLLLLRRLGHLDVKVKGHLLELASPLELGQLFKQFRSSTLTNLFVFFEPGVF